MCSNDCSQRPSLWQPVTAVSQLCQPSTRVALSVSRVCLTTLGYTLKEGDTPQPHPKPGNVIPTSSRAQTFLLEATGQLMFDLNTHSKSIFSSFILAWELQSGTSFLQISKSKIYMTSSSLEFLDKKIIQDGSKCMNLNGLEAQLQAVCCHFGHTRTFGNQLRKPWKKPERCMWCVKNAVLFPQELWLLIEYFQISKAVRATPQ